MYRASLTVISSLLIVYFNAFLSNSAVRTSLSLMKMTDDIICSAGAKGNVHVVKMIPTSRTDISLFDGASRK
jgi:hypothetical protein